MRRTSSSTAVKAPAAEIAEAKRLYDEQRQSGLAAPAAVPAPAAALPRRPHLTAAEPAADKPGKALRPWIEVALPHPDVLANRFKEAEFAADLFAVDSGNAEGDYATPRGFFGITFLTEGLKRVLLSALQRLSGQGGDPVIGLQTAFGGGKTHTLLAVYHLARHLNEGGDPADLPGLGPIVGGPREGFVAEAAACGVRRLRQGHRRVADFDRRTQAAHLVGLSRLAHRRRGRARRWWPRPRRRAPTPAPS